MLEKVKYFVLPFFFFLISEQLPSRKFKENQESMLSLHLRRINFLKTELGIKTNLEVLECKVNIFNFENVTTNHLDLPQSHCCCPTSGEMD